MVEEVILIKKYYIIYLIMLIILLWACRKHQTSKNIVLFYWNLAIVVIYFEECGCLFIFGAIYAVRLEIRISELLETGWNYICFRCMRSKKIFSYYKILQIFIFTFLNNTFELHLNFLQLIYIVFFLYKLYNIYMVCK